MKTCRLTRRGLSIDTLRRFNCGYLPKWKSPKSRVADTYRTPTPRLIIPSGNHYLARLIVPVESFPVDEQKYIRPKQHAGKKALFGANTITDKTEMIYVFEGEIDAMSAFQAYETDIYIGEICAFVATCGAAENKWLDEIDNICKGFNIKPRFKIYFDNDDAGKGNAAKHRVELLKRGYLAISKTLAEYGAAKIDANDLLRQFGEDSLVNRLFYVDDTALFDAAQIEFDELEKSLLEEKEAADKAADNKKFFKDIFSGNLSDMSNANRIYILYGKIIRRNIDSGEWLIYENGKWRELSKDNDELLYITCKVADYIIKNCPQNSFVTNVNGSISQDLSKPQYSSEFVKFCAALSKQWQRLKTQRNAIALLKGNENIRITQADLDKNPMLLNVKNGVVDLETGKLYPAAPELLLTKQCNAAYNPAAPAPLFEEFMKQILPEEETRAAMLRYLGYCLTGLTIEEKVFFAYGKGGNGKSTLLSTIQHLLGDYATSFKIGVLLKQKYGVNPDAASPEIVKLKGVRFAVVSESKDVKQFDTAILKDLTGGDMITARAMYQQPITFKPSHKFFLQGNNLPAPENIADEGFLRRLYIVKFLESFIGSAANLNLKAELVTADSLNGILALLVRECLAWQREGLIISAAMQAAKKEYIEENDFVAEFISDNCELVSKAYIPRKEFLNRLKEDKKFSRAQYKDKQLVELITAIDGISYGKTQDKNNTNAFFGVKWLDSVE